MKKYDFNFIRIIILGGAFVSFVVGAGSATGQEAMQFFAVYGFNAILGIIVFFILNAYVMLNFVEAGRVGQYDKATQVFNYFCGKYIGTFFGWFAVFFCYCIFIAMLAGGGAIINQQFGIPNLAGTIIVAVLSCATVACGLKKMVNIIGVIGPLIIVFVVFAGIVGLIKSETGFVHGAQIVGQLGILSAGKNWFLAVFAYIGLGMCMSAGFLGAVGKTEPKKWNARFGVGFGALALSIMFLLIVLALLANIEAVYQSQIPVLKMISNAIPFFAIIFAADIFLEIYSTAAPMLWTACDRLAPEGSKKYIIVAILLTLVALAVALAVPFNRLINILYVIDGYIGSFLLLFIILRNVRDLIRWRTGKKQQLTQSGD